VRVIINRRRSALVLGPSDQGMGNAPDASLPHQDEIAL